ncbi:MAG: IS66 family transposase [Enterocloster sp.]
MERLPEEFERSDVFLPTQTLCRWAIMGAERNLSRVYARMNQKLEYHVMHADETVERYARMDVPQELRAGCGCTVPVNWSQNRSSFTNFRRPGKEHAREFPKDQRDSV